MKIPYKTMSTAFLVGMTTVAIVPQVAGAEDSQPELSGVVINSTVLTTAQYSEALADIAEDKSNELTSVVTDRHGKAKVPDSVKVGNDYYDTEDYTGAVTTSNDDVVDSDEAANILEDSYRSMPKEEISDYDDYKADNKVIADEVTLEEGNIEQASAKNQGIKYTATYRGEFGNGVYIELVSDDNTNNEKVSETTALTNFVDNVSVELAQEKGTDESPGAITATKQDVLDAINKLQDDNYLVSAQLDSDANGSEVVNAESNIELTGGAGGKSSDDELSELTITYSDAVKKDSDDRLDITLEGENTANVAGINDAVEVNENKVTVTLGAESTIEANDTITHIDGLVAEDNGKEIEVEDLKVDNISK